jgi:hypothetical protein
VREEFGKMGAVRCSNQPNQRVGDNALHLMSQGVSFLLLYCAREKCSRENFARSLFRATLPPNRKVVIIALQWVRPSFFKIDFELAEAVGRVASMDEFENEVILHYGGIRERSWLRDRLKLRMSLHRLRKLAQGLLPKD